MRQARCGLMVARIQMLHDGHCEHLDRMIRSCETAILGLGSTGLHSTLTDPWTQVQRQEMVRNVYGNRIRIVPLQDLGSDQTSTSWCDYVLEKVEAMGLPPVTDYFSGSEADAQWYTGRFWDGTGPKTSNFYTADDASSQVRYLHIIDREQNIYPSATELRVFLQTRSEKWKKWVPAVNHDLVESTYPEHFKVSNGQTTMTKDHLGKVVVKRDGRIIGAQG